MSTPRASKQGRSFQQPRQHPIFDLCFYFTPATSVTPSPRRVLHFTQGQSQHDSRLRAVFSVSPPLQVPLPSDCRFHCRRARHGESVLTLACWYDRVMQLPKDALLTAPELYVEQQCSLSTTVLIWPNEHHPMEVGSIDFAARQPVTNNRCPGSKTTPLARPIPLDVRKLSRCVRLRQKHQPRDVIALGIGGWRVPMGNCRP